MHNRMEVNKMLGKFKKCISLMLVFVMCISLYIPIVSADATLIDFTNSSVAQMAGLPVTSLYTKSGEFVTELSGNNLKKNYKFSVNRDFSSGDALKMWVYSPADVTTPITFVLMADDSQTSGRDFYYTTVEVGNLGWNQIILPYTESDTVFYEYGEPLGLDKISSFEIWTEFEENVANLDAKLYLDKITIGGITEEETEKIVASKDKGTVKEDTELFGDFIVKGGNTIRLGTPPITDWMDYNTLVVRVNNEKISERNYEIWIESENTETVSNDYWLVRVHSKKEGVYELCYDLSGKSTVDGALGTSGIPAGWDKITDMRIQGEINGMQAESGSLEGDVSELHIESIYLANRDWETMFSEEGENYIPEAVTEEAFYDYAADLRARNTVHPRLLIDGKYLEELKNGLLTSDLYINNSFSQVKSNVDKYIARGGNLVINTTSTSYLAEAALVYNITGEEKYAEWIWNNVMEFTVNADTWHPPQGTYLVVAEMLRGMCFCYDWMYNHWTDAQRRIVRNAIMHFGVDYMMSNLRCYASWAGTHANNLTQAMMSAMGLAGIVLFDDSAYDEIVNEIINRVMVAFRYTLPKTVDATGAYREGLSYWNYGLGNFLPFVCAMWENVDSTELMETPGMDKTGMFPIGLTGPMGYYNFGDAGIAMAVFNGSFFFLSRYFDNPAYGAYQMMNTRGGGDFLSLAMYRPDERYEDFNKYMPTSMYFPGANEVMAVRRSWTDKNATFLGLKAGHNTSGSHVQFDIGSYIFDMMGVRWAVELSSDNYLAENYYEDGRFALYRNRAEGQNTLVINPDGKKDQNMDVDCVIDEQGVTDNAAYAVMDITDAYEGRGVSSVKRGFALLNNFGSLLIQDEIKSQGDVKLYTFMHTRAEIEISEDGKSAILTQDGKKLRARLISPAEGTFLNMEAVPLPTSPQADKAASNKGVRKLTVYVKGVKNPTVAMFLTPYQEDETNEFTLDTLKPLRSFKDYMKHPVMIDSLYLDGVPVAGFDSTISNYVLNEYEVGEITADASNDIDITIKQAEKLGETAFVIATSKKTGSKAVYTINFSNDIQKMMEESTYIPKKIITQANSGEDITNAIIDGVPATTWASPQADWIGFDLGRPKELREMKVMWSKGDERYAYFHIDVSSDGENWRTVYDDGTTFMTSGFETYTFEPTVARYIRLYGLGNSANSWVTILEMRVTAFEDAFSDIKGHWAKDDIQHAANMSLVKGFEDETFKPDAPVTRIEFLNTLKKTVGFSDMSYAGTFADIPAESPYVGITEGAYAIGLLPDEMFADGSFKPEQYITCEEMMAIAVKVCNKIKNLPEYKTELDNYEYKDMISDWCTEYMKNANALRLLGGNLAENDFVPTENATRAQMAVVAKRIYIKTH